jgi:hypothetical protein
MFTRDSVLGSAWYRERLQAKQTRDIDLWTRHFRAVSEFARDPEVSKELGIAERLAEARRRLEHVRTPAYLAELSGTIGADVDLGEARVNFEQDTEAQPVTAATAR